MIEYVLREGARTRLREDSADPHPGIKIGRGRSLGASPAARSSARVAAARVRLRARAQPSSRVLYVTVVGVRPRRRIAAATASAFSRSCACRKRLGSVSEVPRKCLGSVDHLSRPRTFANALMSELCVSVSGSMPRRCMSL